jgi:rare lipoprotein A
MPLRRTIGISLASLMISAGAMARTPESATANQLDPASMTTEKSETRTVRMHRCGGTRAGSSARISSYDDVRGRCGSADDSAASNLDSVRVTGRSQIGKAAWYNLVGGYTSNGERLDTVTPTAAHRSLPLSSYARVTSLDSGRSVIVKINDRGPQSRRFIIDLSPRAADELDVKRTGIAAVIVEPVAIGSALANQAGASITAYQNSELQVAQ